MSRTRGSRIFLADRHRELPFKLGRYTIQAHLASGGMAEVLLADKRGAHDFVKRVVLKRVRPELAGSRNYDQMLQHEAAIAAKVNHPYLAQVYDAVELEGVLFIEMEHVEGISLEMATADAREAGEPYSDLVIAHFGAQIALGLAAIHEARDDDGALRNLIHRDVSPDNIIVMPDGCAKLIDFGVVKSGGQHELTSVGELKGKLGYLAPEYIESGAPTRLIDLYALGVTLYTAMAGFHPFHRDTDLATMAAVMDDTPRRLNEVADVELHIANVVHALMERDPAKRIRRARDAHERLMAAVAYAAPDLDETSVVRIDDDDEELETLMTTTDVGANHRHQLSELLTQREDHDVVRFGGQQLSAEPSLSWQTSTLNTLPEGFTQTVPDAPPAGRPLVAALGGFALALALVVIVGAVVLVGGFWRQPPPASTVAATLELTPPEPTPPEASAPAETPSGRLTAAETPSGRLTAAETPSGRLTAAVIVVPEPPVEADVERPVEQDEEPLDDEDEEVVVVEVSATSPDRGATTTNTKIRKKPRTQRVKLIGPRSLRWTLRSGRALKRSGSTAQVASSTTVLLARDATTGGLVEVPVRGGSADYGAVARGKLEVIVVPFATVYLGKKKLGVTPFDPVSLPAGRYSLRLVGETKQEKREVRVRPGATTRLKVSFL